MANEAKNKGYVKIPREVLELMKKGNLNQEETRVLLHILDKSFGFNKNFMRFNIREAVNKTGILSPHIYRAIGKLEREGIIKRENSDRGRYINVVYQFGIPNKYTKSVPKVYQIGTKKVPNKYTKTVYHPHKPALNNSSEGSQKPLSNILSNIISNIKKGKNKKQLTEGEIYVMLKQMITKDSLLKSKEKEIIDSFREIVEKVRRVP